MNGLTIRLQKSIGLPDVHSGYGFAIGGYLIDTVVVVVICCLLSSKRFGFLYVHVVKYKYFDILSTKVHIRPFIMCTCMSFTKLYTCALQFNIAT